jgi:hypothetical protein
MTEQEALTKFLLEEQKKAHDETRKTLDELRRTRKTRGGVGAPLDVPFHLKDAARGMGIIVTDADLNPDLQKPIPRAMQVEKELDEMSDQQRLLDDPIVE